MNLELLLEVILAVHLVTCRLVEAMSYCKPEETCWPTEEEIHEFRQSLSSSSSVLTRDMGLLFHIESHMLNPEEKRYPGIIVLVQETSDVQLSILFARKYNIRVILYSSGHCFVGRSSEDDGLLINMKNMKSFQIYKDNYEMAEMGAFIVAEPGVTNYMLHRAAHRHGLMAPGGSGPTVAMGGFVVGGGHSPNTRSLGLAVDNLLGATIVTADGSVVEMNETTMTITDKDGKVTQTDNTDLFWAIRGGGGGFGVVTQYIIQLHPERDGYTQFFAMYKFMSETTEEVYATHILTTYVEQVLPHMHDWGGYLITGSPSPPPGIILFSLLHNGKADDIVKAQVAPLNEIKREDGKILSFYKEFDSFWDYQEPISDPVNNPLYMDGRFSQPEFLTRQFVEDFVTLSKDVAFRGEEYADVGCTIIHLGGNASSNFVDTSATAVSEDFREAQWHASCTTSWTSDPESRDRRIRFMREEWRPMMKKHGRGGYYNEPGRDVEDVANEFWGAAKYQKLVEIKRTWDPDNVFNCWQCVGYEPEESASSNYRQFRLEMLLLVAVSFFFHAQ